MSSLVLEIGGERYLTTGQVAALLDTNQRTVLRWVARKEKGRCPELLKRLECLRDPTNGFTYFKEQSVLEIRKHLLPKRKVRRR